MGWTRSRLAIALALVLTLGIAVPTASATVGAYLTMPGLVGLSEVIVTGTVVSQETVWSADHRLIYTRSTVQVAHRFKGSTAATIVVETVGGRIGHAVMHAEGTPTFTVGEEVMLFLHVTGEVYFPTALSQGVYHFHSSPSGATATRDLSGMTLVTSAGVVAPSGESAVRVADLEAAVARLVGGGS
jgi:hypothetical protein